MIVKQGYKELNGKDIITIDKEIMIDFELTPGDVVQITHPKSKKVTAAVVEVDVFEASEFNWIRMDFFTRRNLGAKINDKVDIEKIECIPAEKVIFSGYNTPHRVKIKGANRLAKKLNKKLITQGDILSFYHKDGKLDLIVKAHIPQGYSVRIHPKTKITCKD